MINLWKNNTDMGNHKESVTWLDLLQMIVFSYCEQAAWKDQNYECGEFLFNNFMWQMSKTEKGDSN